MKYKILVDAVFIHIGGGKTLLEHLLNQFEKIHDNVYYLLDKRIQKYNLKFLKKNNIEYINGSIFARHSFYKNNKYFFKKVLCLASLPPTIKLNVPVYTLFHQYSYIKLPLEESFLNKIKWFLKSLILSKYEKNTDRWLVQSGNVKKEFSKKFHINIEKISCLPFYDSKKLEKVKKVKKKENKFAYISFSYPYKNHYKLIKAFSLAFNKCQKGELHLTVDKNNRKLINKINLYCRKGVPIYNHGTMNFEETSKLYASSEFLIFPSTMESFGLPLIEAIHHQCKVIVADLPYANFICKPSFKFDPYDVSSIADTIIQSMVSDPIKSKLIIKDQTSDLINLLLK